jgi:hypothetical protein
MHAEPQQEHHWLQQLVGEWEFVTEAKMGPEAPPQKFGGRETARSLGALWVLCEGYGEMPGGCTGNMVMTLGYDPAKKHYVGTWVGSMMTHLWVYRGELDSTGKMLTLEAEGPSFAGDGGVSMYRDVIEIIDPNHRTLTSYVQGEDGDWRCFMSANFYRK